MATCLDTNMNSGHPPISACTRSRTGSFTSVPSAVTCTACRTELGLDPIMPDDLEPPEPGLQVPFPEHDFDERPVSLNDWRRVIERRKPVYLTVEDIAWLILNPDKSMADRYTEQGDCNA